MILCPDCRESYAGLAEPRCLYCGWELQKEDELPVMLAPGIARMQPSISTSRNYAGIAQADLTQDPAFIERQIERLVRLAGPVRDLDVCDVGVGQGGLLTRRRALGAGSVTGIDIDTPYLRPLRGSGAHLLVAFDGFLRDRLRRALRRHGRVHRRVRELLDDRCRTPAELIAMNVHRGWLMFRPNTPIAVARREAS